METLELLDYTPTLNISYPITPDAALEDRLIRRKREILFLKMAGLSYHQVISFFRLIHGVKVTKYFTKTVIEEAGIRAKQLNGRYDAMARVHFRIIEIDEVFQGQKNCYLAIVDKDSHYTLLLDRIENRSIETIAAMLEPLSDCLDMQKIVEI